jgi:excinuclease ABC subunit C
MEHARIKKLNVPDKPGVYFFIKGDKILYIGKATSLRSRVRSYFNPDLHVRRGPITVEMVARAEGVKYEVTGSVLEALILEANLIKKHRPQYNIKEKDDKSFNYVVITREELSKVMIVRGRVLDRYKGTIFGPYTSGPQLREALKIIRKIFPYLDDKSKNYLEFYRQINLAPDLNDTVLYKQNIKNIKLFLAGKKKEIARNLKREMLLAAKNKEFEKAEVYKRQLFALQHINDVALIKEENLNPQVFRIEAYDVAHMSGKSMVGVMTVVEGQEAVKNDYRKFRIRTQENANDTGALREVLKRRLIHQEWRLPDLVVVDGSTAQINVALKTVKEAGLEIPVVSVIKDEHHRPRGIGGDKALAHKYEREILLANSEAHRFAIAYHKNLRGRNFLGK